MAAPDNRVTPAQNSGRERILARIRRALEHAAPAPSPVPARPFFAAVGDPLERLRRECEANKTELVEAGNPAEAAAAVEAALDSLPPGEIFVQDSPALRALAGGFRKPRAVRWSSQGAPSESSQATVSEAELLVALTGSILVSASCGGRGASVVAPCHVVVARREQLVPDLETALARVRESGVDARNSFVGLITGSSRTADIEKILVLGAHGPRRLVLVLQTGA